jgi:SulP family sulfate permease
MTQITKRRPEQAGDSLQLLPNLFAGLIIGLMLVFMALSFAALIFSGDLSPFISRGIGLALLGTAIIGLVIASFTSLPGTIGGSQGVSAAITATMTAALAAGIPGGGTSPESFATVVAAIAVVTLATGLFFWILGRFRLGGLVRFLPYPVVGGFLAGTGWLLVTGAIAMMVDLPPGTASLSNMLTALVQPQALYYWLPGLVLALMLLVITRRSDHFLVLPVYLVGAVLLFFFIARLAGISVAELGAGGWLLGPFPEGPNGGLWRPITPAMLSQVNWSGILNQLPNIVAIMAVSAMSLLLNAGGLELATDRDMEINHELQVAGAANLLAGLAGGLVGFKQLGLSTLNFKMGGNSRLPGLVGAVICLLVLVAGSELVSFTPKVVIGSLLFLLGLNFLYDWVFTGWFKLPRIDYAIVLVILFVTMAVGFLQAVALGLLLAVVMFVISYSQVDVVRHELSGESYQSRVIRRRPQEQILTREGNRLYILQLQGFIFFGTANNLLNQIRRRINDPDREKPAFVVLDFQRVAGLDSTAMLSFTRMKQLAQKEGFTLVFTQPNERVSGQLWQSDLVDGDRVQVFESLDMAVESCENLILENESVDLDEASPPLAGQLAEILSIAEGEAHLQALLACLEQMDVQAGQVLMRTGDKAQDLFFIESGQVTAQLSRPGRPPIRLETTSSGNVVGEIGFYLGLERTADVISDERGTVYRLSLEALKDLERNNPEAASVLHQVIVHLLAERVVRLTHTVQALER